MNRTSPLALVALAGAAVMLSGFAGGGGRVKSGPAIVPYVCEDGRQVQAVYENGGDYLHARVQLSYDGQTADLAAAPTLSGARYEGEGAQRLAWSLRGERALLAEVASETERPIAQCTRLRAAVSAA